MSSLSDVIVQAAWDRLKRMDSSHLRHTVPCKCLTKEERERMVFELQWIEQHQPRDPINVENMHLFNRLWKFQ